ncbi:MAG: NAD(P)H-dependent glycerol-3-phosphate dehydrogenase [Candidatus Nucleicultricaceae bacterium]
MTTVSIIGGGAWGTALALSSLWAENSVVQWMRNEEDLKQIQEKGVHERLLPGIQIPSTLTLTQNFEDATLAKIILLVTPAQTIRDMLQKLKLRLHKDTPVVICAKGIEMSTGLLLHQVAQEVLHDHPIAILSGPTFAHDVAMGSPTTATLAASTLDLSQQLCQILSSKSFRLYPSDDLIGVAVAGSLKNVIALAAGIAHGKGLSDSSKASLITRGLAEITRLGKELDAKSETFLGPAGVGDLVLSCTSLQSRNMKLGQLIGESHLPFSKIDYQALSEGVYTARAVRLLSRKLGVDMPISDAVYNIIYEDAPVGEEIEKLLARPLKMSSN